MLFLFNNLILLLISYQTQKKKARKIFQKFHYFNQLY